MQKITTFLTFDRQAEQAARLYTSIFEGSEILKTVAGPQGSVLTVEFTLFGQTYVALNGGPQFRFSEAVSLAVSCDTQAEVDRYWQQLTADGGSESQCGWLKDKFGLSWQIVPKVLSALLADPDPAKSGRVMQAMLKMRKLDIATLQRAAA